MDERVYYLGFSYFHGIGPKRFQALLSEFGSAQIAWNAEEKELKNVLGPLTLAKFLAFRKQFSFEKELLKLEKKKIIFLTTLDNDYPPLLKNLANKQPTVSIPFALFIKGRVDILSFPKAIAVVGTRKITQYGRDVTQSLTSGLVGNDFVIVSGLAFGVDAVAHGATIKNKGKTIAVLGCGVDCCSPTSNQPIYDQILDSGGTIVSSFRPQEQALLGSFPARNAIIAGLSLGVLVTEGTVDSGALITADYAKKWNRPIFAVPGPITSGFSKAPNGLLQKGAIPVTEVNDILNTLNFHNTQKAQETGISENQNFRNSDNPEEQSILSLLEGGPLHFDEIVRRIGKDSKQLGSLLSFMEIKGIIKSNSGTYFL